MTCLDEERVLSFVEGDLAADERQTAEKHLARCDDCRAWVARAAEALLSTGLVSADPAADEPMRRPRSGDQLGRYRVIEFLGAGAMGVVVQAFDTELERNVALKLLRRDSTADSRKRFLREAKLASAISHPGIVTVYDVLSTEDGHPVLVMDHLEGETLREYLKRAGRLTPMQTATVMLPVLDALAAAHECGIVHRDLKPENIFLQAADPARPMLLDFGVAKLLDAPAGSGDLTRTGAIIGTPHYMAPEQAFAERDVDQRADLWSVGVMIYECLCKARPIEAESVGQVFKGLALGKAVPLAQRRPELPERVTGLVDALLAPRQDRPASARDVHAELAGWTDADRLSAPARARAPGWIALAAGATIAAALWFALAAPGESRQGQHLAASQRKPGTVRATSTSPEPSGALHAAPVRPAQPGAPGPPAVAFVPTPPAVASAPTALRPSPPAPGASGASSADPAPTGPGKLLKKPPF